MYMHPISGKRLEMDWDCLVSALKRVGKEICSQNYKMSSRCGFPKSIVVAAVPL